jgi:hypothetical protein
MSGKKKVKFRVNLGSRDAGCCGLDFAKCTADSEVYVSEDAAKWLTSRGIAVEVDEPKKVKAIAKDPEVTGVSDKFSGYTDKS